MQPNTTAALTEAICGSYGSRVTRVSWKPATAAELGSSTMRPRYMASNGAVRGTQVELHVACAANEPCSPPEDHHSGGDSATHSRANVSLKGQPTVWHGHAAAQAPPHTGRRFRTSTECAFSPVVPSFLVCFIWGCTMHVNGGRPLQVPPRPTQKLQACKPATRFFFKQRQQLAWPSQG